MGLHSAQAAMPFEHFYGVEAWEMPAVRQHCYDSVLAVNTAYLMGWETFRVALQEACALSWHTRRGGRGAAQVPAGRQV